MLVRSSHCRSESFPLAHRPNPLLPFSQCSFSFVGSFKSRHAVDLLFLEHPPFSSVPPPLSLLTQSLEFPSARPHHTPHCSFPCTFGDRLAIATCSRRPQPTISGSLFTPTTSFLCFPPLSAFFLFWQHTFLLLPKGVKRILSREKDFFL